ncbi:prevent-host-death family protein [Acinetobacter sp. WC-323]|uniref:type II toxin-antitoxin system Phd/YefM family antitoxin n=1 Tax=Acinetobacter sp. WC-323 TaxID=903918 RepID=UPI00029E2BD7|nr:type II toxin-antitoxin system Phd/YefM family antitoxin [Acinetobacter sp. WC-323]EKU53439.1 prevent-host-death family protein [Acinetobacter sp. WC-323]
MSNISFTHARANLAKLIQQSQQGQKTFIAQHGHTSAVLISYSEYQKLQGEPENFMQAWENWHQQALQTLNTEPTDFHPERDSSQGREFSW